MHPIVICVAIKIIVFSLLTSVQGSRLRSNDSSHKSHVETSLFRETKKKIQSTVNKIFTTLRLKKDIVQKIINSRLYEMHEYFINISKESFKMYKDIKLSVKVTFIAANNKTDDALINTTTILQDIFQEMSLQAPIKTNKKNRIENISVEWSMTALKQFVEKIRNRNSTVDEILGFPNKSKINKANRRRYRRNLKAWRAPAERSEAKLQHNASISRRIFQGTKTKINRYPFTVSVHVMGEFVCAGAIISKNHILSAASCLRAGVSHKLYSSDPNVLTARAGSDFIRDQGDVIPIVQVFVHPAFEPTYLANNLAVGRLIIGFHFRSQKKIRRITYGAMQSMSRTTNVITVLGWGEKDFHVYSQFEPLSFAHLDIYDHEMCKEVYSHNYVTDKNFCAGFASVGSGACRRDLGSPGIVGSTLVGLVSFGPPVCGTPDAPTVFTDLGFYVDWIDSIVDKDLPTRYIKTNRIENINTGGIKTNPTMSPSKFLRKPKVNYLAELQVVKALLNRLIQATKTDGTIYDETDIELNITTQTPTIFPNIEFDELFTKATPFFLGDLSTYVLPLPEQHIHPDILNEIDKIKNIIEHSKANRSTPTPEDYAKIIELFGVNPWKPKKLIRYERKPQYAPIKSYQTEKLTTKETVPENSDNESDNHEGLSIELKYTVPPPYDNNHRKDFHKVVNFHSNPNITPRSNGNGKRVSQSHQLSNVGTKGSFYVRSEDATTKRFNFRVSIPENLYYSSRYRPILRGTFEQSTEITNSDHDIISDDGARGYRRKNILEYINI